MRNIGSWVLLAAVWIGCCAALSAQTLSFTEYPVTFGGAATFITTGPDGALWFTYSDANQAGRITTEGSSSVFPGPPAVATIATGSDGALWFTNENEADYSIQRMTTGGTVTSYPLPTGTGALTEPLDITAGPDGALWFTASGGGNLGLGGIGRISTSGVITEYPLPLALGLAGPEDITTGPDGALWFTIGDGGQYAIGRITTTGSISAYPFTTLTGGLTQLRGITAGPDGALWFAEVTAHTIGRITTAGAITQYNVSVQPGYITSGPDGALWFVQNGGGSQIYRITTSGVVTSYSDSADASAGGYLDIITGPDGALWTTGGSNRGNTIFRIALTQPDGFFDNEQALGSLFYLQFQDGNPFGYYGFLQGSAATASAWVYHFDLGYEYVTAGDVAGDLFFYDLASMHWWYTSSALFPYLYDFTLNSWIYYFPNTQSPGHYTTNPRYFSNLTTKTIFMM